MTDSSDRPAQGGGPRPRVFLIGYYGVHNAGDEAVRQAIETAAAQLGVDIASFASRGGPIGSRRAVPTSGVGLVRYVRAIVGSDRVVLGGGGILKDEGLRLPLELFATALAARLLGKPVSLLAVGVGPFYTRLGRWLIAATARLADVRTVRDVASAEALRRLGVGDVEVGADPTYSWDVPAAHAVTSPDRKPEVLISVRPWFLRHREREREQQRLRDGIIRGISELVDAGWGVGLMSLYWPRDQVEAHAIAADGRLRRVRVRDREIDWTALLDEVAGADLVVAMRYHAVVAASLQGRPVIALAYEPKVVSLATELRIPIVRVEDPYVGATLQRLVRGWLDGETSCAPDPEAIVQLRHRAWRALARALTGVDSSAPPDQSSA